MQSQWTVMEKSTLHNRHTKDLTHNWQKHLLLLFALKARFKAWRNWLTLLGKHYCSFLNH